MAKKPTKKLPKKNTKSVITITKQLNKRKHIITIRSTSTANNAEDHLPQPSSIMINSSEASTSCPGSMQITLNMSTDPRMKQEGGGPLPLQNEQGDSQIDDDSTQSDPIANIQPNGNSEESSSASETTTTSSSSETSTTSSSSETLMDEAQGYRLLSSSSSSNQAMIQVIRDYRRRVPTPNSSDEETYVQASGHMDVDQDHLRNRLLESSSNSEEDIKQAGDM